MTTAMDDTDLGPVTEHYAKTWAEFKVATNADCGSMHGHECNFNDWVSPDFHGNPLAEEFRMSSRPRATALMRLTHDCAYDSLSLSMSPLEAGYILHRFALLKCIAETTGSMQGLSYGVALASGKGAGSRFVSRVLHGMHMHDSYVLALAHTKGGAMRLTAQDRTQWSSDCTHFPNWSFHGPSSDHLCGMNSSHSATQTHLAEGRLVRPKHTEVREVLKNLACCALGGVESGAARHAEDYVPTHEIKVRGSYKERQVAPAVTWGKLLALAKPWRYQYGWALCSESVHRAARNYIDWYCNFRRQFIMRLVDAGASANFASKAFTKAMEHGLIARPVGCFSADVHGRVSDSMTEVTDWWLSGNSSAFVRESDVDRWVETFDASLRVIHHSETGLRGCGERRGDGMLIYSSIMNSRLPMLLPVPRLYIERYPAFVSGMKNAMEAE